MELKKGKWNKIENRIRFRTVEYYDPCWGYKCIDYEYQIFKRRYLLGLV